MWNKVKNFLNKFRTRWEICGQVITNTFLHAIVGLAFSLSAFIAKLIPEFIYMIPIGFFIGTVGFELAQKDRALKWNYVDSIVDILAANIAFHLGYWLIWYLI